MMSITKAVFPAAGLGTRFLPATKASPKEMMPLVDKPLIQWVVEEAVASGIREIIMITGRGKRAIEDHFDISYELENNLKNKGKGKILKEIKNISNIADFCFIRQKEPLGLGHAILCAKRVVNNDPFAVLLGDDIIDSEIPVLKQMINIYNTHGGSILAIQKVKREDVKSYGIIKGELIEEGLYRVLDLVEKPNPSESPSDLAIIGRYILSPKIFEILEHTEAGKNNEIQLTDALKSLVLSGEPIFGYEFKGKRYDAGDKLGFIKATVEFTLKNPDLGEEFKNYLLELTSHFKFP
jgi:UTP--glucose-1-phosphate uridylyltransferase